MARVIYPAEVVRYVAGGEEIIRHCLYLGRGCYVVWDYHSDGNNYPVFYQGKRVMKYSEVQTVMNMVKG